MVGKFLFHLYFVVAKLSQILQNSMRELKKISSLNIFKFIEHKQITAEDLRKDGIHFADSVEVFLA